MNLSKHFTLREFTKSQTAERKGIINEPDEDQIESMEQLCENVLEKIRSAFAKPININSGYRSVALCEAIGSKSTSQHCKGEAADIEIYGVSNYELAKYIEKNLNFDQLILECWDDSDPNSGWVHISYVSNAENRKDVLTYSKETGYTKGIE
jgi:zinc D-Ala-D-Ala carboxypeptidase